MNLLSRKFKKDIKEQDFSKKVIYIIKFLSPNDYASFIGITHM
jgi:hypothetical protein